MAGEKKDTLPTGALYDLVLEVRRLEEENRAASRRWGEAQVRLDDVFGLSDPPGDKPDDDGRQETSAVVLTGPEGTFVVVNELCSATVYPAVIRTVGGVWRIAKGEWIMEDKVAGKAQHPMNKREQVAHNFTYHPPKEGQPELYTMLRNDARALALLILDSTPESREQSLALTKLEEVVFWANAAIARRG